MQSIHRILLGGTVVATSAYFLATVGNGTRSAGLDTSGDMSSRLATLQTLEKRIARLDRNTRQTQQRTQLLAGQVAAAGQSLEEPVPQSAPGEAPGAEMADPEPQSVPLSPQEQKEQQAALVQRCADSMEEVLIAEAPDRAWESELAADLAEAMSADSLSGSSTQDIRCVESLCRLTVGHEDGNAFRQFLGALYRPPLRGNAFYQHDPDTGTTTTYLARAGEALPLPPELVGSSR